MKPLCGMIWIFAVWMASTQPSLALVRGKPVHGLALLGEPRHGADFKALDYVNPDAPKGGALVLANELDQTFDTFNGFTLKGAAARYVGLTFDTLMASSLDEPFSVYCLVCETVEIAPDGTWVQFTLRPEAKFRDGTSITADDVVFSFTTLMTKGAPVFRLSWSDVTGAEARDSRTVRFKFKNGDTQELPLVVGQLLRVFSKKYWEKRDFSATTLEPPLGGGPYAVENFEVGKYVLYRRDPNYWGRNLPINRGQYNFDHIRYEYFRDDTARFEAFKTGGFDVYREATARQWVNAYDFPAAKDGRVKKLQVTDGNPMLVQSLIPNLRRPLFQDRRVRQALNYAFDFESLNRTLFYGQYRRLRSYAQKSELEAKGLPSSGELALLEPLRGKIPPEVFSSEFTQPVTDGQGAPRENLLKARALLTAAGWTLKDGRLQKDGRALEFEILEAQAGLGAMLTPWFKNLERLGIKATFRVVDSTQYLNRLNAFDFDMVGVLFANSLSPGSEQREFWGSGAANQPGGQNYGSVSDPAVDALVEKVVAAPDRTSLITATRALDRVLTWNFFRVLTYSSLTDNFAHWSKLLHPERFPLQGMVLGETIVSTWWMDPAANQPTVK
ncbi:MAG: ABC transporter substrate-binding protein [Rhodospirillaceae bacterium]|nr:ABC transporter substrate-binding protein [Rhodospirillaceae bacterium]